MAAPEFIPPAYNELLYQLTNAHRADRRLSTQVCVCVGGGTGALPRMRTSMQGAALFQNTCVLNFCVLRRVSTCCKRPFCTLVPSHGYLSSPDTRGVWRAVSPQCFWEHKQNSSQRQAVQTIRDEDAPAPTSARSWLLSDTISSVISSGARADTLS